MRTIKVAVIGATLLGSGFDGLAASDNVTDRTASVAVGAQYDSTHIYVAPGDLDRLTDSLVATFGGTKSRPTALSVTPTPSETAFEFVFTPVGTFSVFGFKTPIPYPFGAERTGYLVTNFDAAVKAARADGADEAPPREVVVLWAERLTAGPNAAAGATALLRIADSLAMPGVDGAGLLEVPVASNGRGLREAGVLPNAGPGLAEPASTAAGSSSLSSSGRDAQAIAEGLAAGELAALYLLHSDPLRDLPEHELWERALASASTVVAHSAFLTEGIREHADVIFPAEAYAEKEGTVVHPDGRVQRLRPAIARPGAVRAEWHVLSDLALQLGLDLDVLSGAMASAQLFDAVPFYEGLTLEEIGGRGVRWQERASASAFPPAPDGVSGDGASELVEPPEDAAAVDGYRSVWDAPEVEFSPSLEFLFPHKQLV